MEPTVVITHRGEERLRAGHPWIYRGDVADAKAAAGETVRVLGPRRRPAGYALFSDRSEIALRMLERAGRPFGPTFWIDRLRAAMAFRQSLGIDATAYRLVHAEADRLPSLVVDRYGDYLVIQALSQGMDRLLKGISASLAEWLAPRGILARNDARVRLLEGLEQRVETLYGEVPELIVVREAAVEYEVNLRTAQKTGLFLDQRENHAAAAQYARGRLLDAFSYHGGFALHLAPRCREVLAIDSSAEAVAALERNAVRNGLSHVRARVANAFDALRELERGGERFETIVLDPPAFAKQKAAVDRALGGYKEINLRALRILEPGGCLVTCSCSYHVDEATFLDVIHAAALDAHAEVTVVERRMQARDHPVLLGVPETSYLKCVILRKLP